MNQRTESIQTRGPRCPLPLAIGWLLTALGCNSQNDDAAPADAAVATMSSATSSVNTPPAAGSASSPSSTVTAESAPPSSPTPINSATSSGEGPPQNSGPATGGSTTVGAGGGSNGGSSGSDFGGSTSNGSGGDAGGGDASGGDASTGGTAGEAVAGAAGSAGQSGVAGAGGTPELAGPPMHREILMYNDVPGELLYVNNADPTLNWRVSSGAGRDMQLIGNGRVLLGKGDGWDEYQLSDGALVGGVSSLAGTQSTHRLADGNTVVASIADGDILLRMADVDGQVVNEIRYEGYTYVRLVRPTSQGNFLVTADTKVFEGDADGNVVWEVTVPGSGLHVWKAMRLANGDTAIATGYAQTLQIYNPSGALVQTIGGTAELDDVYPEFFADFHRMPSGNFFVVNSQADRTEDRSVQLLEFDAAGTLVWQQKQPDMVTSLEAAIVLDGLDLSKLHVEPEGQLLAVE